MTNYICDTFKTTTWSVIKKNVDPASEKGAKAKDIEGGYYERKLN